MPTISSTFCAITALAIQLAAAKDWDSPAYNYLYQFPLPIPEVKKPLKLVHSQHLCARLRLLIFSQAIHFPQRSRD